MAEATLSINSRNYGSWSLRGWLLCKMAGLDFDEQAVASDDPSTRAELLLLSPSFLVPCLTHDGIKVWDTLAIAEYLNEILPERRPAAEGAAARAHCRSICGEMHSGFSNMRSALPMNLKAHYPGFKVWAGAQADIDRVVAIWRECLAKYGGPFLFGASPGDGGCDVCAGVHALPHLRREARFRLRRLLQGDHGAAGDAGMDRRGQGRAGRSGRARRGVLSGAGRHGRMSREEARTRLKPPAPKALEDRPPSAPDQV